MDNIKTARLLSDYATNTWLRLCQTDDGDICVVIQGNPKEEFRIATQGSRYGYSKHKPMFLRLCRLLMKVMNAMERDREGK